MTQVQPARTDPGHQLDYCYVELLGSARLAAGRKQLAITVSGPLKVVELLPALAQACPALIGPVLDLDRGALVEGHILNRSGRDFIKDPTELIQPGDRLLLMSSSAGG